MKKYLIPGILLLLLGMGTWYLIQSDRGMSSYDFSYREFAVDDLSSIDKIIVVNKTGEPPFHFTRKDNRWIVNGKYLVNQNVMENMLDAIRNVQIDYVPPNNAHSEIMKGFLKHGIKVELFNKRGKKIKAYYIGSSPTDGRGSYYVMDGYDIPFVMKLPTVEGNIHTRFNYTLEQFRDLTIVAVPKEQIKKIEVSYPFNKKFSFKLEEGRVYPLHPFQKSISGVQDQMLTETFLAGFAQKYAEYIENQNKNKNNILAQTPFCEMRITKTDDEIEELTFYYFPDPDNTSYEAPSNFTEHFKKDKAERFFIMTNRGDFYLAQLGQFQDILWKYDAFFKKGRL